MKVWYLKMNLSQKKLKIEKSEVFIWDQGFWLTVLSVTSRRPVGAGGAMAPPDFGRSVNPISTRRSRFCPPHYHWYPRIFRLSYVHWVSGGVSRTRVNFLKSFAQKSVVKKYFFRLFPIISIPQKFFSFFFLTLEKIGIDEKVICYHNISNLLWKRLF